MTNAPDPSCNCVTCNHVRKQMVSSKLHTASQTLDSNTPCYRQRKCFITLLRAYSRFRMRFGEIGSKETTWNQGEPFEAVNIFCFKIDIQ